MMGLLAVATNLILVASTGGDGIDIDKVSLYHGSGGMCPAPMNYVVYQIRRAAPRRAGEEVQGCWWTENGRVWAYFTDGDLLTIKINDVKWEQGRKPPEV